MELSGKGLASPSFFSNFLLLSSPDASILFIIVELMTPPINKNRADQYIHIRKTNSDPNEPNIQEKLEMLEIYRVKAFDISSHVVDANTAPGSE